MSPWVDFLQHKFICHVMAVGEASNPTARSQQAGRAKAIVASAERIGAGLANDHVVEECDIHGLRGFAELAGHLQVGGAWRGVAAGVIVHTDHSGGSLADRGAEDLARVGEGCGGRPGRDLNALQKSVFPIEAKNPELLHLEPRHKRLKIGRNQIGAPEHRCVTCLLPDHSARNLHDRDELKSLDPADTLEFSKIGRLPGDEAGERTGFGDQAAGKSEDVLTTRAAAQKHREQLRVAQGAGAKFFEPFLRAFANGDLPETIGHRIRSDVWHGLGLQGFGADANPLLGPVIAGV